ncbi:MAG: ferritin [Thermodesulfobacteriota bacterium]
MIGKKMEKAINGQINAELYSAYLYLSMSAWFSARNLPGFANWMRVQAQEEMVHVMKFYDYLLTRGGTVTLGPVDGPPVSWKSPLDAFEAVYAHEQKVTALIHGLMDVAIAEKDHAARILLDWFVNEQVEEEESAVNVVNQLKLLEKAPGGLYMLDKELGQRVFTPPAPASGN